MIGKYIILALIAIGTLLTVGTIGKERKPITPGAAVASVIVSTIEVLLILLYWK